MRVLTVYGVCSDDFGVTSYAGMPYTAAEGSMGLFSTEVMPVLMALAEGVKGGRAEHRLSAKLVIYVVHIRK